MWCIGRDAMIRHLYQSKDSLIHLCESAEIDEGLRLVWTKCDIDVPENSSFMSTEEPTCPRCTAKEKAELDQVEKAMKHVFENSEIKEKVP